jgi:hypothetical protein
LRETERTVIVASNPRDTLTRGKSNRITPKDDVTWNPATGIFV